jgi:hypothetical protein
MNLNFSSIPKLISALGPATFNSSLFIYDERNIETPNDLMVFVPIRCSLVPGIVEATRSVLGGEWHRIPIKLHGTTDLDRWSKWVIDKYSNNP